MKFPNRLARALIAGSDADDILTGTAGDDEILGLDGNDHIDGGAGADHLVGGLGDDYLSGGADDDILRGGSGSDTLYGGDGDDWLDGGMLGTDLSGPVADYMAGGAGNDTYIFDELKDQAFEEAGQGIDTIRSKGMTVVLADANAIENVVLLWGAVGVYGNSLDNDVTGSNAANMLSGGAGDDILRGNGGADTLAGGSGNDTLIGGAGRDLLDGGEGADRFVFDTLGDSTRGAVNADTIYDFRHDQGDRIILDAIDAAAATAGDDAFTFIGTHRFNGTAGELRYRWDASGNTVVQMDVDGDGLADMSIVLLGRHELVGTDFVL